MRPADTKDGIAGTDEAPAELAAHWCVRSVSLCTLTTGTDRRTDGLRVPKARPASIQRYRAHQVTELFLAFLYAPAESAVGRGDAQREMRARDKWVRVFIFFLMLRGQTRLEAEPEVYCEEPATWKVLENNIKSTHSTQSGYKSFTMQERGCVNDDSR